MDLRGIMCLVLVGLIGGVQAVVLVQPAVHWLCGSLGTDPTLHPTIIKFVVVAVSLFLVLTECVVLIRLQGRTGRASKDKPGNA